MKNRTPFKLRSGNKPSIAKIAGVEKETPMKRNIFKDINTKLQNLGKKAQEFKAKRKAAKDRKFSEDKIDVKRNIKDQVARTRRGESKFQERARIRRESRLTDAKKKEIRDLTAKAKAEKAATTSKKKQGLTDAEKKRVRDATKKLKTGMSVKKAADKTATTKTTFKGAFAAARKAGKKEFTYKGKKYTTKLKSETSSKKATPKYDAKKDPILRNIKEREEKKKQRKSDDPLGIKKNLLPKKNK
tara:strand:+ start:634 stop:1365 length:732 start_codon:yes stop_codon:yes gene_type:complete